MSRSGVGLPGFFAALGYAGRYQRWRKFSATEVRHALQSDVQNERNEAVRRCMTRANDWLPPLPEILEFPYRYHTQMARIVYWYACGETLEAICERLGDRDSTWRGERALRTACTCIARCLNQAPDTYWAA